MPDVLWMEVHDVVQETGIKTIPKEKKMQKGRMIVCGDLTNNCEKKRSERQRRKGKVYLFGRRQWHPTPVLLPGKSHGQRSLVGCSPWGR